MGLFLGILSNVIGGTSFALAKVALEGWPPAILVLVRLVIALPFVYSTVPRGWTTRATRGDWGRLAVIGVLGLGAPHIVGIHGLKHTDSVNGAILVGLEPVGILVLARIFLGETLRGPQLGGVALAFAGAVLVVSRGELGTVRFDVATIGSLMLAVHSLLWAIYTIAAKPTLARVPPSAITFVSSVIACVVVAPFAVFELPALELHRALSPAPLVSMLALAIGVSWLSSVIWNRALVEISASLMAVLLFVQPLTGMVVGAAMGEPLPVSTLAGAALIFSGVWLSREPKPARDPSPRATER
ncbi:DMT family transporter [Myxococcota bacterium]|nr:DMT family transporter [Myxococcota bacterium]